MLSRSFRFSLLALAASPMSGWAAEKKAEWHQVHADIQIVRRGTIATAPDGQFEFVLDVGVDQVMQRQAPDKGEKYPRFFQPSGFAVSQKVTGKVTLSAQVVQKDESTGKTFTASADLVGKPSAKGQIVLDEVANASPWGEGMTAKIQVNLSLKGGVKTNYPKMDGVKDEDAIMLWPTPVGHNEENGFTSEGEWFIRPTSVPLPEDPIWKVSRDMIEATNSLEFMPSVGGFRPLAIGAVTEGDAKSWVLKFSTSHEFDTLVGGKYTEEVTVVIRPTDLTLPLPAEEPEAE